MFSSRLFIGIFIVGLLIVPLSSLHAVNFGDAQKQFESAAGKQGAGLDTSSEFQSRVGQIIQVALSLVGVIFLALMLYGGFLWMTARGEEATAKKAKDIIVMAVIGLVIITLAYTATYLVTTQIFNPQI